MWVCMVGVDAPERRMPTVPCPADAVVVKGTRV